MLALSGGAFTANSGSFIDAVGLGTLAMSGSATLSLQGGNIGTGSTTGLTQGGQSQDTDRMAIGNFAITNTGTITATGGTLTVYTNATGFANTGTVTISSGTGNTFVTNNKYSQSSGTTTLRGTLTTPNVVLSGGTFTESGGTLQVSGSFAQSSGRSSFDTLTIDNGTSNVAAYNLTGGR